jgi:hypothetical protein
MRTYLNLAVLALALATSPLSPVLSAPIQTTQYRYRNPCRNLLVSLKGWALLISGFPLGTLG